MSAGMEKRCWSCPIAVVRRMYEAQHPGDQLNLEGGPILKTIDWLTHIRTPATGPVVPQTCVTYPTCREIGNATMRLLSEQESQARGTGIDLTSLSSDLQRDFIRSFPPQSDS